MRNSTIIPRKKRLECGCYDYAFSKNRCKKHATIESTMKRMERLTDKVIEEDNLQDLIKDADAVVSQYVRLSNADKKGNCKCYTCGSVLKWREAHAGHYISRGQLLLRFDVSRNIRVQCPSCNVLKRGNLGIYAQRLEKEQPGLPDILLEESHIVYKPSREELKQIIREYSDKLAALKK